MARVDWPFSLIMKLVRCLYNTSSKGTEQEEAERPLSNADEANPTKQKSLVVGFPTELSKTLNKLQIGPPPQKALFLQILTILMACRAVGCGFCISEGNMDTCSLDLLFKRSIHVSHCPDFSSQIFFLVQLIFLPS